jgi:N-acetylglucosaminyl-diphospho-decaprenol L-rhamnosyltransferase
MLLHRRSWKVLYPYLLPVEERKSTLAFVRSMPEYPKLSIIMVTYNSEAHVGRALQTLDKAAAETSFEVIVIDNASVDATTEVVRTEYPDAKVILSPKNLGFAAACNLGARHALGDFLLFVNPDTETDQAAIDLAVDYLTKHPEVGIVGGRTRYPDGRLNPNCCFAEPTLWSAVCYATGLASVFRGSRIFNPEALGAWDRNSDRVVDVITGCFALLRTPLFRYLTGFDERFFMYSEDTDLSRRVRDLGLQCVHLCEASLVHFGGGSDNVRSAKLAKVFGARSQYYDKHWTFVGSRMGKLLIDAAVITRRAASTFGPAHKRATWRDIWIARELWHRKSAAATQRNNDNASGEEGATISKEMTVRPTAALQSHTVKTRLRMTYRMLGRIIRFASTGDFYFARQGLSSLLRIPWFTIFDLTRSDSCECNICRWKGRNFYPDTGTGYNGPSKVCPGCGCQGRDRSLLALLVATTTLFAPATRVVEVAPTGGFGSLLKLQRDIDYTSFDLARPAMERSDITAMRFPDSSVDYFICFHVLEHVPNDHLALAEIRRVLKPGGTAILQVNMDWDVSMTREHPTPDPWDVRHVRRYGTDFPQRIASAGFDVVGRSVLDVFDATTVSRFGMSPEPIFFANRLVS